MYTKNRAGPGTGTPEVTAAVSDSSPSTEVGIFLCVLPHLCFSFFLFTIFCDVVYYVSILFCPGFN